MASNAGRYMMRGRLFLPLMFEPAMLAERVTELTEPNDGWSADARTRLSECHPATRTFSAGLKSRLWLSTDRNNDR
jgi:hypothetical protein